MNIERMQWIIENLKDESRWEEVEFNMGEWFAKDAELCGTVCCAFGTLYGDKRAKDQGLEFKVWTKDDTEVTMVPVFNDEQGIYAVTEFLEIPSGLARWIFYPESYPDSPTRRMVIDRLSTAIITERSR